MKDKIIEEVYDVLFNWDLSVSEEPELKKEIAKQIASRIEGLGEDIARINKYARHQYNRGTMGAGLVPYEEWKYEPPKQNKKDKMSAEEWFKDPDEYINDALIYPDPVKNEMSVDKFKLFRLMEQYAKYRTT